MKAALSPRTPAATLECWTTVAEAIRDWVATAQAGAEMVYARAWHLPSRSPAAMAARRLEESGHVALFQRRKPGSPTEYLMRRLRAAKAVIGRPPRSREPRPDGDMARMLRVLRRLAREGLPCPANRDLAKLAGIGGAEQARYVMRKLANAGTIRSEIVDRVSGARVIAIVGSGAKTASPTGAAR